LPNHCVLVHTCCDPEREALPKFCSCQHHISKHERDVRLARGELLADPGDGRIVARRNVKSKKTPRATTIEQAHIERAYGYHRDEGSDYERRRIETYLQTH
jgi:hypothetical protein